MSAYDIQKEFPDMRWRWMVYVREDFMMYLTLDGHEAMRIGDQFRCVLDWGRHSLYLL